jgi:4-hydroxybenzoate polyprenyltransferase
MRVLVQNNSGFFKRIWVYSREMFPVLIYLPYVVVLYMGLNFTVQALTTQGIVIDIQAIVGMITAFFMMLQMRTFDDLKDIDIDKDLFPERATPRGAVKKSDIQLLSAFSFVVLLAVNLFLGQKTLWMFGIMIVYALLTFKWFFAEKFHREHVFFTMLTHQPLPIMINLFLIHTALAAGKEYHAFTFIHFLVLLMFSLPVTAWEVSRKIRSADKETQYETFSMLFGARGAAFIPFLCLLISGAIAFYLGFELTLGTGYFVVSMLLMLYVVFFYIRFIVQPTHSNNTLKQVAMVFTTALFVNLLLHVLLVFDYTFSF